MITLSETATNTNISPIVFLTNGFTFMCYNLKKLSFLSFTYRNVYTLNVHKNSTNKLATLDKVKLYFGSKLMILTCNFSDPEEFNPPYPFAKYNNVAN